MKPVLCNAPVDLYVLLEVPRLYNGVTDGNFPCSSSTAAECDVAKFPVCHLFLLGSLPADIDFKAA